MIPLKKQDLLNIILKDQTLYLFREPTRGTPLQKLVNPINKGVGEGPCALPKMKSWSIIR